jgi:hypothetical protein
MRDEERGKRLIAAFLLGVLLLNFPLLAVVEAGSSFIALPPLAIYLFGIWGGLILLLALIVEARGPR